MATTWAVSREEYVTALKAARAESDRIKNATPPPEEMPDSAEYFLTEDKASGYGVTTTDELIGLYSLVRGRGEGLVLDAIQLDGAAWLDCFDGFLPKYYEQFGFREYMREANRTEGGPDVVFMRL